METETIKVNRTDQQPEGVEIEIVKPQGDLEGRLLSYFLTSHVRRARADGRFALELPEQFNVEHRGEGTFVINRLVGDTEYYEQPRPVAIVGIRVAGNQFDLVHASLPGPGEAAAAPAGGTTGATAGSTPTTAPASGGVASGDTNTDDAVPTPGPAPQPMGMDTTFTSPPESENADAPEAEVAEAPQVEAKDAAISEESSEAAPAAAEDKPCRKRRGRKREEPGDD